MLSMVSLMPSLAALGAAAAAALLLAVGRWSPPDRRMARDQAARALAVALGAQCVHFVEELMTGFRNELPALFGLSGIPLAAFVIFNLMWIAIWVASIAGLRAARSGAFFAAWFLAIAGTLNGVAHPLFAVRVGGYFPGLLSAPFVAIAALRLWRRLGAATCPKDR
jgi:hypothetical protein